MKKFVLLAVLLLIACNPVKKTSSVIHMQGYFYLTGNEPFTEWAFFDSSGGEWLVKSNQTELLKKIIHKPVTITAHYGKRSRLKKPYLVIIAIKLSQ